MPKGTRDHQSWLIEKLTNPIRAAAYLNAAREDSREMFLEACRDVAQARQMSKVARDTGVTRKALYKVTSAAGNPTLTTFDSLLDAFGLDWNIKPKDTKTLSTPPTLLTESRRSPSSSYKRRRRRGIGGYSQRQMSLHFDANQTATVEMVPSSAGVYLDLAQQQPQVQGVGIVRVVSEASSQFRSLPGFLGYYATQNEAGVGFVPQGQI
jgi:probable addiction module antidote protein